MKKTMRVDTNLGLKSRLSVYQRDSKDLLEMAHQSITQLIKRELRKPKKKQPCDEFIRTLRLEERWLRMKIRTAKPYVKAA